MSLTCTEARQLAEHYRLAAAQLDRLTKIEPWREIDLTCADVDVSWDVGRSVDGYQAIRELIEKKVQALLPGLVEQAIQDIETSVHIARRALPKPDQAEAR